MVRRRPYLLILVAFALVASGCSRLEVLSTEQALERLTVATSKVYDANGNVIADLHGEVNRDIAPLESIPKHVRDAVVAIEDERFWRHQGMDLRSIARAAMSNLRSEPGSGALQGGSTIPQQLAKNIYFERPDRTLSRKLAEARVTLQLERQHSKAEILEMYLNTIYLGRGVYGIETAAQSYFDKSASELTLAEGAFLAGLIHEPARYEWRPTDPPQRRESRISDATRRRNHVLNRMVRLGLAEESEAERAKAEELVVQPRSEAEWDHPYFVDLILRQLGVLRTTGTQHPDPRFDFLGSTFEERSRNVYRGGLRIYTTLDPKAQGAAEEAIAEVLPEELERLSASLVAIEPSTGYVRALVGGRDYYPDCEDEADESRHLCQLAKVNLALGTYGGGSGRQPGSAFKPFVLAAALERGIPLYQFYGSDPFVHPLEGSSPWRVANYDGAGGGHLNLVDATARSVNAVFARLEIDGVGDGDAMLGAHRVAETARRMGISFPTEDELKLRCGDDFKRRDACIPADEVPAIALGAKEVSPMDMASAYATFANDGMRVEPTAIVRIEDNSGRIVYEADPGRFRAIPRGVARGATHAMQQVLSRGTGGRAAIDRPAAAKTGTSQMWRDAWLAGYTPQLAAAVWVGNPIPRPGTGLESMTTSNGYPMRIVGGTYPSMIWNRFMTAALEGVPVAEFHPPPTVMFRGGTVSQEALDEEATPPPEDATLGGPQSRPGTVPAVIGMSFGNARSSLRIAGYSSNIVRSCDPNGNSQLHEVFSQSPGGGTEAQQGSTVTLHYQGGGCP